MKGKTPSMRPTRHTQAPGGWRPWETSCRGHSEAGGSDFRFFGRQWLQILSHHLRVRYQGQKIVCKKTVAVITLGFAGHTVSARASLLHQAKQSNCSEMTSGDDMSGFQKSNIYTRMPSRASLGVITGCPSQGTKKGLCILCVLVPFPEFTKKIFGFCPVLFP